LLWKQRRKAGRKEDEEKPYSPECRLFTWACLAQEEVVGSMRKTAFEIVSAALEELEKLKPTPKEIQDYADLNQDAHGVVTYSI
jgi:hypothetical protein